MGLNLKLSKEKLKSDWDKIVSKSKSTASSAITKLTEAVTSNPKLATTIYSAASKLNLPSSIGYGKKQNETHAKENAKNLPTNSAYKQAQNNGGYIENQSNAEWAKINYGFANLQEAGCGIFATYNTLVALGENPTADDLVDIISSYEKNGMALGGKIGTSPYAVRDYLAKKHSVKMTFDITQNNLRNFERNYTAYVSLAVNNRSDITSGGHYVSITRHDNNEKGADLKTNPYQFKWHNNGGIRWQKNQYFYHLYDTIENLGTGAGMKSAEICLLGVNK